MYKDVERCIKTYKHWK